MSATAVAPAGDWAGTGITRDASDAALVAAVRVGDDHAFEALYERYRRRIGAYVYGMVSDHGRAEDITQEVFFAALRRMRETERPIAFKPWIYEIARNACIDQFRRASRSEEVFYDCHEALGPADSLRMVANGSEPDHAVDAKQRITDLCGAFGGLSDTHHTILVLRELEGLSYQEIGERMALSRAAVESTLFRARRRLTEEYEELASGRRCERVQAIVGSASQGMLGARDRQRVARHVSHCQPCRRYARLMGVEDIEALPARGKLAAILPLPFVRRGDVSDVAAYTGQPATVTAQVSAGIGATLEPLAHGWAKAVATLVALAVGSAGVGVATKGDPLAVVDGASSRVHPALTSSAREAVAPAAGSAAPAPAAAGQPLAPTGDAVAGALDGPTTQAATPADGRSDGVDVPGAGATPSAADSGLPTVADPGIPNLPAVPGPSFPAPPDAGVLEPRVPEVTGGPQPPALSDVRPPPFSAPEPNVSLPPESANATVPAAEAPAAPAVPTAPAAPAVSAAARATPGVPDPRPLRESARPTAGSGASHAETVAGPTRAALAVPGAGG